MIPSGPSLASTSSRRLLGGLPSAWACLRAGRFIYANPALAAASGAEASRRLGRLLRDLCIPEIASRPRSSSRPSIELAFAARPARGDPRLPARASCPSTEDRPASPPPAMSLWKRLEARCSYLIGSADRRARHRHRPRDRQPLAYLLTNLEYVSEEIVRERRPADSAFPRAEVEPRLREARDGAIASRASSATCGSSRAAARTSAPRWSTSARCSTARS